MKTKVLVAGIAALGFAAVAYYMLRKGGAPTSWTGAPSATGGIPVNALPARMYAMNRNFSPSAQPPQATFTPFSGVPVIEGLLGSFGGGSVNQALSQTDSNPISFDTTDNAQVTSTDSGTTTFFG